MRASVRWFTRIAVLSVAFLALLSLSGCITPVRSSGYYQILWPTAYSAWASTSTQSSTYDVTGYRAYDNQYFNGIYYAYQPAYSAFYASWDFVVPNETYTLVQNHAVTHVDATVIGYQLQYAHINEGWFSVRFNPSGNNNPPNDMPWYGGNNIPYSTMKTTNQTPNSYGWHNSTVYPYKLWNGFSYPSHTFDITSCYNWTIDMLVRPWNTGTGWNATLNRFVNSHYLCILFNTPANTTPPTFNYIGISITTDLLVIENPANAPWGSAEMNIFGLLWLLFVFFPAIALNQYIPKIGFIAGITITLLLFGFTQAGFFPFMLVGLAGVGITTYKGI